MIEPLARPYQVAVIQGVPWLWGLPWDALDHGAAGCGGWVVAVLVLPRRFRSSAPGGACGAGRLANGITLVAVRRGRADSLRWSRGRRCPSWSAFGAD